ncbi:MAG: glycoside hydrolase family 78 protein [Tannerella sp.]|nr:glycoside hydrolase family 78 protein [Tannerella sp.]
MRENPQGIGASAPRLSWKLKAAENRVVQAAYRIEVAATPDDLRRGKNLLWDSGKTDSDCSILIPYAGKPLASGQTCFWRVTVWTNLGGQSRSETAAWSMGLQDDADWKAAWIGINDPKNLTITNARTRLPARYLRRDFTLSSKSVRRAVLYISGLGSYVPFINGERVGNDVFAPLPTLYTKTVFYNTYDVTDMLRPDQNAIGVALGNGRYLAMRDPGILGFGLPRLIAQLDIEYTDGKRDLVVTDPSWQATAQGPIIANNEFDGEDYDARLEQGDWAMPGYDAAKWQSADPMDAPGGKLTAQTADNITVAEQIKPISVKPVDDGKYILDMGQNMVGWLHVRLKGIKDRPVILRFAETLKANGTELYTDNLRSAQATDTYIPARDGEFSWEPLFVYHGFRFVEIAGIDYLPDTDAFTGKIAADKMAVAGRFETSDTLINRIYQNAFRGIRGNYRGMPTDCPQRDERLGWLGDRATGAHGESFIFNNHALYAKWLQDIEESMNENHSISVVSPKYWTIYNDDVTWPSAFFYIADMLHTQFGDNRPILTHYPAMKRWVQRQTETQMQDYILMKDTYGDWCMPPERQELIHSQDPARKTAPQVLSTTVFYSILQLMNKFATLNNAPDDAKEYLELAAKIKDAYNRKFFDFETARYDNNTVTANILSLRLGLVPEGYEQKVFDNIVEKTEKDFGGHVSTGVLGIQHLMRGLTEYNRADLACKIVTNETYPSWGYMVKKDATTIWELWNGDTADPAMNSANHVMLLGDLIIWFYENLAGIKNDPQSVGFKQILMQPVFPESLDSVDAAYESPFGTIESKWIRNGDKLTWHITIPANTTATVKAPARFNLRVAENPAPPDVKDENGTSIIQLGSGSYLLQSR